MRRDGLRISNDIDALSASEREEQAEHLEAFLDHRSPFVRMAAAKALGSVDLGEEALRRRLRKERNELVVCDICDALSSMMAVRAIPDLEKVATNHAGPLARKYAYLALLDIRGVRSLPFFRFRLPEERSRRTLATLVFAAYSAGESDLLCRVIRNLYSDDAWVRRSMAKMLQQYPPKQHISELVHALGEVIAKESYVNIKKQFTDAQKLLIERQRRKRKPTGGASEERSRSKRVEPIPNP